MGAVETIIDDDHNDNDNVFLLHIGLPSISEGKSMFIIYSKLVLGSATFTLHRESSSNVSQLDICQSHQST